jgi:DNA mismatch repair protein MutL
MTEFERVVLVNPQIAFTLNNNDSEILNLPVSGLRQRIINVFGKNLNQKLLSLDTTSSLAHIEGFVGRTDTTRRKGALNYFFVNGRYMRHPYFHRAIMQAYEPLVPTGETPDYFIYLTIDPSAIDVNIHPTKTEIKFADERPLWQILFSAVRETLGKSNAVPTIDFDTEGAIEIPVYHSGGDHENASQPKVQVNAAYNPFHASSRPPYTASDWETLYKGFEQDGTLPPNDTAIHRPDTLPANDDTGGGYLFSDIASPCFQYKNRYIITPLRSGLVLIDQHRAHVRILYDQYISNLKKQKSASQQVLFPEVIEFTVSEAAMLARLTDEMRWLGFDLSPMGKNSYSISGLPAGIQDRSPAELIKELVNKAMESDGGSGIGDEMVEALALSLAKTSAIRPGKVLTVEEMESIVAVLFSSEANNLTPDGKLILSVLTDEELARRFK